MITHILRWACRLFLAGTFIYAGYTKLENPLQFAAALEAYQLLSPGMVIWVIKVLPWLEVVLGVALLLGIFIRFTAAIAGGLLVFFIGIMLITYLRGIEADCGCFGVGRGENLPIHPQPRYIVHNTRPIFVFSTLDRKAGMAFTTKTLRFVIGITVQFSGGIFKI